MPGVYEEAWRETARDHPEFAITVGDTIQGLHIGSIDAEWRQALRMLAPYRRFPIFLTPGNHDVWSAESAQAFERYTKHPLHYSFDYRQAHFTILDDSRSDRLPEEELGFLERDLEQHRAQSVKFIFSHRPSWILPAVLGSRAFPLHQLAKKYGVQYVIAGHIHQMLAFRLDSVNYLSTASSGGHLRASRNYESGWSFGRSLVTVQGNDVKFEIKELSAPFGRGRVTSPEDWGAFGLKGRALTK